jgi:hypothetical protein
MGNVYQRQWVAGLGLTGPVVEVGSRLVADDPDFYDYRALFPTQPYVGIDIEAGSGVDVIADLATGTGGAALAPYWGQAQTLLCLSTLEHVPTPWTLAAAMTALLAPKGTLVLSVPFAWVLHDYPSDYWRFSPSAVRVLFPDLVFDEARSCWQSGTGRTAPLADEAPVRLATLLRQGRVMVEGRAVSDVYLCQPGSFLGEGVMLNMVGTRRGA